MIKVSQEFKQQLVNENRRYATYADITLTNGSVLKLSNKQIWMDGFGGEDAVSSSGKFDIGGAIVNSFFLVLNNLCDEYSQYDFEGAIVEPWIGLEINGGIEKIRKGKFTVVDPQYNGATIKLNCYDNMYKFDKGYKESRLTYPATLGNIVKDACNVCGVALGTYDFPHSNFVVNTKPAPETTTFRNVISWCAQIAGCFARCNINGQLEIKWFKQSLLEKFENLDGGSFNPWNTGTVLEGGSFKPWNTGAVVNGGNFTTYDDVHFIYSTVSVSVSTDDVVITGVRVVEKNDSESESIETTYQSGRDGYVISVENNALIQGGAGQTIAGWLGAQLIGFSFRTCNASHLSDPTIEAGDVALLIDRKGNAYKILVSATRFTAGAYQTTESSATTPAKNSSQRYTNDTRNYVEYRKLLQKEKTAREKALEELGNRLATSPGLYTTQEKTSSGIIYYLHNKPALKDSDIIWKMTAEAWGVSSDGGKTWNGGMTVDGDTIARILTATGINADWINTGSIMAKDKNGNVVFSVNIETGEIVYSAFNNLQSRMSAAETKIVANANGLTSTVKKGEVSSQISQESGKVSIKGNRLIVEADNFKLNENGDLEVCGKYTAKFVRRYDKNTFTAEEATRARKIVAGYEYDDITQEELDKYDLFGDGLKLNDAFMIARFVAGTYDWYDIVTEISIDPTGYSPCIKAVTYVQFSENGVISSKTIRGETKISGSGLKAPEITTDKYSTTQTIDEEVVEYSGATGTFTSADGKTVEVVNGLIVAIY